MGLFSNWGQNKQEKNKKRYEKMAKTVANRQLIKEERMAAIEYLASENEADEAVTALLGRFTFSLEHGIQDEREKNKAFEGILRHEEAAIEPVTRYLKEAENIAWPAKILAKLVDEDRMIELFKSCLDFEDTSFDLKSTDRNYDVLSYLRDYSVPNYKDKIAHFLTNHDEKVRFAAAECLIEQKYDGITSMLEKFVADTSSENIRIREVVLEYFVDNNLPISEPEKFEDGQVTNSIRVDKKGFLHRA